MTYSVRFMTWRATARLTIATVQNRLRARCLVDANGCWLWTKSLNPKGYGKTHVWANGKVESRAHRVSYLAFVGPIPSNRIVMHLCNTNSCINPTHLKLGTHSDNMAHAMRSGTHVNGERHPGCKLSDAQVLDIRERFARGEIRHHLAKRFGVSWKLIRRICDNNYRTNPTKSRGTP